MISRKALGSRTLQSGLSSGIGVRRMADVKCTICGDQGHVASDCKQAAEQHKKEPNLGK